MYYNILKHMGKGTNTSQYYPGSFLIFDFSRKNVILSLLELIRTARTFLLHKNVTEPQILGQAFPTLSQAFGFPLKCPKV